MALSRFQTDTFRAIMRDHLYNVIAFLLEEGQEFAVAAEIEPMEITPELPRDLRKSFGETALFVLAGYTYESAWMDEEALVFEAGFGDENLGAEVRIPLLAIKQVFVGEYPIAINITSPEPWPSTESQSPDRSMEALLRNPENQKLLKDIK